MSRKKPIKIKLKDTYQVLPECAYKSKVVKSGNGAVIKSFKRFIGRKATVIVEEVDNVPDDIKYSASPEGWKKVKD